MTGAAVVFDVQVLPAAVTGDARCRLRPRDVPFAFRARGVVTGRAIDPLLLHVKGMIEVEKRIGTRRGGKLDLIEQVAIVAPNAILGTGRDQAGTLGGVERPRVTHFAGWKQILVERVRKSPLLRVRAQH